MSDEHTKNTRSGIDRAIQWAGGQAKLARILGVTRGAVNGWKRARKIPAERALQVEILSLGSLRAVDLVGSSGEKRNGG